MKVKLYKLYRSSRPEKKFDIYVLTKAGNVKKVSFGATGYEDYTIHKDKERRSRYRTRHRRDKIRDPTSPGFWSWWVLWGESSSLSRALSDTKRKFKLVSETIEYGRTKPKKSASLRKTSPRRKTKSIRR